MSFSFDNLNLENVTIQSGGALSPGRHVCVIKKAEAQKSRAGGGMIMFQFEEVNGNGLIRKWINVHVPSSQKATRIGREELKTILVYGSHPNPESPFADAPVSALAGLTVGVRVQEDIYIKDGEERKGSKVVGYFDPAEVGQANPPSPTSSATPDKNEMDDDIPF